MGEQAIGTQATCPHCGGTDVVTGVRTGLQTEPGGIGLQFRGMIFTGTKPLLADLCRARGTVTRFWVQRVDREWRVVTP